MACLLWTPCTWSGRPATGHGVRDVALVMATRDVEVAPPSSAKQQTQPLKPGPRPQPAWPSQPRAWPPAASETCTASATALAAAQALHLLEVPERLEWLDMALYSLKNNLGSRYQLLVR